MPLNMSEFNAADEDQLKRFINWTENLEYRHTAILFCGLPKNEVIKLLNEEKTSPFSQTFGCIPIGNQQFKLTLSTEQETRELIQNKTLTLNNKPYKVLPCNTHTYRLFHPTVCLDKETIEEAIMKECKDDPSIISVERRVIGRILTGEWCIISQEPLPKFCTILRARVFLELLNRKNHLKPTSATSPLKKNNVNEHRHSNSNNNNDKNNNSSNHPNRVAQGPFNSPTNNRSKATIISSTTTNVNASLTTNTNAVASPTTNTNGNDNNKNIPSQPLIAATPPQPRIHSVLPPPELSDEELFEIALEEALNETAPQNRSAPNKTYAQALTSPIASRTRYKKNQRQIVDEPKTSDSDTPLTTTSQTSKTKPTQTQTKITRFVIASNAPSSTDNALSVAHLDSHDFHDHPTSPNIIYPNINCL